MVQGAAEVLFAGSAKKRVAGRVYAYLAGASPIPQWMETRDAVHKFGAQAVFGRVITVEESRTINMIDTMVSAYFAREAAGDKAAWVEQNGAAHQLLAWARRNAMEIGFDVYQG